jgi:hypothetical protein
MSRRPGDLIIKDPQSTEPQGFDWTSYLAELGASVTIQTSTWSITGADWADSPAPATILTAANPSIVTGGLKTQVHLAAGTAGRKYTVTNRIVTNTTPSVTDERSFYVRVLQR